MFGFILTLLTAILLIPALFFAPPHPVGNFYHSPWFWVLGGIVALAALVAAPMAVARRSWTSFVSHLGVLLLFIGLLRETRAVDGLVQVREGETASELTLNDATGRPLGFEITLTGFQEQGYVSRVRFDHGPERTIAPSHPARFQSWLVLQEAFDRTNEQTRLTLLSDSGDTIRVGLGERLRVPGSNLDLEFERDYALTRDTLVRFRLFENGVEQPSGFISRNGIRPPTLKLGVKLLELQAGARYISVLRFVRRPGAGLVFFSFLIILVGLAMLAAKEIRRPENRIPV